jgi:hypothetical protein
MVFVAVAEVEDKVGAMVVKMKICFLVDEVEEDALVLQGQCLIRGNRRFQRTWIMRATF